MKFTGQSMRDLCTQALKTIGIVSEGNDATAEQLVDAIYIANEIIDSWNIQDGMIYSMSFNTFDISGTQESYTIGPGGDFDTPIRPVYIEVAMLKYPSQPSYELPLIALSADEYASIRTKQTTTTLSSYYYYEPGYPLGKCYFWPILQDASQIVLTYWKQLDSALTLDDIVSFPPGYARALRYNVLANLAPMYGKPIPADIMAIYQDIKTDIMFANVRQNRLQYSDELPGCIGWFNIYSGTSQ